METVSDFILGGSKTLQIVTVARKLKDTYSLVFCICCAVFSHSVVSHFYVYLSIMKIIKIKGHMNILMRVSDVVIEKK